MIIFKKNKEIEFVQFIKPSTNLAKSIYDNFNKLGLKTKDDLNDYFLALKLIFSNVNDSNPLKEDILPKIEITKNDMKSDVTVNQKNIFKIVADNFKKSIENILKTFNK